MKHEPKSVLPLYYRSTGLHLHLSVPHGHNMQLMTVYTKL